MTLLLGVDTGGTYTDAVLIRDEKTVIATAKSLTTRQDLAIGIGNVVQTVLDKAQVGPEEVSLASLSTTLATNALVEGQGARVGLVYIGFDARDLNNSTLTEALGGDPVLALAGGHDHAGGEAQPFDADGLRAWLTDDLGTTAFAVASQFATRNPAHEQAAMQIIADTTGRPVSASHHLSAKLNGPKRALTAVLNARLVGLTHKLIGRAEAILAEMGVTAPLMVVRGDGALISADMAKERPIETILSGPAASIVGARWLTGCDQALVSDIGGTTTDIALLRNGRPSIDPQGAQVGKYRTMVEAVAMRTTGLGGDSEVQFVSEGLKGGVTLGPRRVLPISLIAHEAPDIVLPILEAQMRSSSPGEYDGRFVRVVPGVESAGLPVRDASVLERIGCEITPLSAIVKTRLEAQAVPRLVARGLIQVSGPTPSDASHVLGFLESWNTDAAVIAMQFLARKRTGAGEILSKKPEIVAQMILDQLSFQTSQALLTAAFAEEENGFDAPPEILANHELMQRGLAQHSGLLRVQTGLAVDVIGLGASAATYYPAVGKHLNCQMILPEHAEVANAIGAVVGRITMRRSGSITSPSEGAYRVHFESGPKDFVDSDLALRALEDHLKAEAEDAAVQSGAEGVQSFTNRDVCTALVESREVFVEATVTVEATGRPRVSH